MKTPSSTLQPPPSESRAPRWQELDGIRCFAVAGVLAVHFGPGTFHGSWGNWGVRVFFVLSGFLITGNLLSARTRIERGLTTKRGELGDFFLRRIVRLWPLYFAVLAVTFVFNVKEARMLLPWNLTFTTNLYVILHCDWPSIYSHFWTLAVEQQFYLFWPFLLLFAPLRAIWAAIITLVILAPLLRAWELGALAMLNVEGNAPAGLLLPMCADSLAWGAILALLFRSCAPRLQAYAGLSAIIALCLFGALYVFNRIGPSRFEAPFTTALADCLLSLASIFLINHCICTRDSALKRLLRLKPLVYVGVISYGVYVLHNFAHWFGPSLLRRVYGHNYFATEAAHITYLSALTLGVASLSWYCFERPIMRLVRRKPAPAMPITPSIST